MVKITGILKKEEIREFTKKDGTPGRSKSIYIEVPEDVYPMRINCSDVERIFGKIGDTITVIFEVYPYTIVDGKRKRALMDMYIPNKK